MTIGGGGSGERTHHFTICLFPTVDEDNVQFLRRSMVEHNDQLYVVFWTLIRSRRKKKMAISMQWNSVKENE